MKLKLDLAERPIIAVINENENVLFLPATNGMEHCYMISNGEVERVELTLEQILAQSRNLSERRALREGDTITIKL